MGYLKLTGSNNNSSTNYTNDFGNSSSYFRDIGTSSSYFRSPLATGSSVTTLYIHEKSLVLNNTSQYLSIPDSDSLSFGDSVTDSAFSLSIWVNPDTVAQDGLFYKEDEYRLYTSAGGDLYFILYDGGVVNFLRVDTVDAIPSKKWTHITATYDGSGTTSGMKIYFNGEEKTLTSGTGGTYVAMENGVGDMYMGFNELSGTYFGGKFTQPCVWSKELSQSEIRELVAMRDLTRHSAYANLTSWWEFDDAGVAGSFVADRISNTNDGTLINSPSRSVCVPYPYSYQLYTSSSYANLSPLQYDNSTSFGGYAWDFDGSNEYITIPDTDVLSFGNGTTDSPFSISAWIKLDTTGKGRIICKYQTGTAPEWNFDVISNEFLSFRMYDASTSNRITCDATVPIDLGTWTHVCGTYDGSSSETGINLYINGQAVAQTQATAGTYVAMENSSNAVWIGRLATIYNDGKLADIAVFDKELNSTEVEAIYNNHSPRDEANESLFGNIVGYWRGYNSSNGSNNVLDQSINVNHGTMTNMEAGDVKYSYAREVLSNPGSIYLDGVNQFIQIPDSDDFSPGDGSTDSAFSVGIWVRGNWQGAGNTMRLVGKWDNTTKREWYLAGISSSSGRFQIIDESASGFKYRPFTNPTPDGWAFIVGTYDGSGNATGLNVYINGVASATSPVQSGVYVAMENTTQPLEIGHINTGDYPEAYMAHVSYWNKELSICEILEAYNDGSPPDLSQHTASANLVSWWKLDSSDTLPTATDSAGTNDGTYQNSPTQSTGPNDYPSN